MDIKKCDRCGQVYDMNLFTIEHSSRKTEFSGLDVLLDGGYNSPCKLSYDLCDECVSELMNFLDPISRANTKQ